MISNLPEDVMSSILALVPIRDAVRTSILSKEWRYKWVTIPDVVFNGKCLMAQSPSSASNDVVFNKDILIAQWASSSTYDAETACAHVVDQIVSQLIGPIYIPPSMWNAHDSPCTSIQFIGYLHGVERLALTETFLQYLCIDIVPKKLSATLDHLKYLEVDIELNSTEILAILCILRSSPNLEQLKIKYCVDDEGMREGLFEEEDDLSGEQVELYGVKTQFDCFLCHLHAVEIIGLSMFLDLQFIRWILSNAPVLKTIKIYTNVYVEAEKFSRILKELLQSRRAASHAEIIYLGHYEGSY